VLVHCRVRDLNVDSARCLRLIWIESSKPSASPAACDHALETLREAIKAGWKDFAHMQKDPDLTVLRDLPEFKALVPQ